MQTGSKRFWRLKICYIQCMNWDFQHFEGCFRRKKERKLQIGAALGWYVCLQCNWNLFFNAWGWVKRQSVCGLLNESGSRGIGFLSFRLVGVVPVCKSIGSCWNKGLCKAKSN